MSLEVTTRPASPQASVIVNPFARKYVNVFVGASKSEISQLSVIIVGNIPDNEGACVSSIEIDWVTVVAFKQRSVTV